MPRGSAATPSRPRTRLTAALVLAGLCAATFAACGEAQIDSGKAEAAIKRGLTRQTGIEIGSVSCPDDVKVERGGRFRCEAVGRNGDRAQVLVTQRDDDGTVTWRVIPSS